MEIGNMCFGNSRGEVEIERGELEDWFYPLYNTISNLHQLYPGFENPVFKMRGYVYDEECDCGSQKAIDDWSDKHDHANACYQKEMDRRFAAEGVIPYGWESNQWNKERKSEQELLEINHTWILKHGQRTYDKEHKVKDAVMEKLCKEHGLSFPLGCAVHCTCTHDNDLNAECEKTPHKENCAVIQPHFLYKPTGYSIMWYKYPFRDSYANRDISDSDFREMVRVCMESL